jgi:hypothetical protein
MTSDNPLTRVRIRELEFVLSFHKSAGRITDWERDVSTWLVRPADRSREIRCTLTEAEYLCIGLDSASRSSWDLLQPGKLAALLRNITLPILNIGKTISVDADQLADQVLKAARERS